MIGIIIIIILSIPAFIFIKSNLKVKKEKEREIVEEQPLLKKEIKEELIEYKVDIKGQINNPGIYTLGKESRVIDVIEKAGGLNEFADTSVINLSKKISDEMVIIIYSKEEVKDFEKTKEKELLIQSKCKENEIYTIENNACISSDSNTNNNSTGKVSINTASKEELMTLPGIGESKANEIINYRESNGNFNSIEDIKKVTGIGDNLFAQIKENITT